MAVCSKKQRLIVILVLLLLLCIGIGVGIFFLIRAEEACEQGETHGEEVVNDMYEKIKESHDSPNISTRQQSGFYHEAIHVLERLTCTEQTNTWGWKNSTEFNLPGYAGEECCAIPHPAEMPDISWIETIADRFLAVRCQAPDDISDIDRALCTELLGAVRQPFLESWKTDGAFVRSFYQGVNPLMVRLVRSLDEIREELRNLNFGGQTLGQLLQDKRLVVADYSALTTIPLVQGRVFYAPQVLLVINLDGSLGFLAIHLYSPHAPPTQNNQIVTKDTPTLRKLFAWMHVALADAQIHEFSHHLRDHFVMEAVSVARHNWLNDDHLIGRLLKPHMTGTIFINFAARHSLVKTKDSLVQQQFSVGRDGAMQLISEEMSNKYFWQNMTFPKMMEERGFPKNKSDGVENYYYRDDGFTLWDALHKYVKGVVEHRYHSDKDVAEDEALAGFHASLADPKEGNIPGFPQTPGNRTELTNTLTSIIFTGSVQHQAVNAPQFTYSYQPHRPVMLTRWMPKEGDNIPDMDWILNATAEASKEIKQGIYQLTNILSTPMQGQCNLLSLDVFKDDVNDLKKVHETLKLELQHLSNEVKGRAGDGAYNFLDPAKVACSIDI